MLDLHAGVDLQQIELTGARIEQELDSAGPVIAGGFGEPGGGFAELIAGVVVDHRAGRFLNEFLMAALHGAVALEQVDRVTELVPEHLHLDVAGVFEELFDVDRGVAEGGVGLGHGAVQPGAERDLVVGDAHAASAPAGRGLDDDREADLPGGFQRLVLVFDLPLGAGERGHLVLGGELFAGDLVAEFLHGLDARADELDVAGPTDLGEVAVL